MSSIVVCGGGVIGLATALMLGRDGHDIRLLEDDEEAPPASTASAWSDWVRKGVPQFRQPHNLFPRFQQIVGTELPDITQRLLDSGCVWLDLLQSLPPTITDRQPRDGDDRFRYVVKGAPVVTGLLPVGDAWACTNPSAGRGLSVGLVHAQLLRDIVRAHDGDAGALAVAWDEATERVVAPFFVNQRRADRARIGEMDAAREDRPAPLPDPAAAALLSAAMHDGDVFRALIETVACLALPEIAGKVANLGGLGADALPGPDRRQLMALVVA